MKNLKYFSFERNKYFYGKLLSVDDFETEQRYMNDKRRILNRFVNGCGVVCGMETLAVDDATICVERGIALDFAGREVIIENPVTKKLSLIQGFDSYSDEDNEDADLYLCVGYDEKNKEAVHNISHARKEDLDEVEYNKYQETYRLYLTTKEPDASMLLTESFYKDGKVLYRGNGFRITQEIPKYLPGSSEAEMKIILEKYGQGKPVSFSYELESQCIKDASGQNIKIVFDEEQYESSNRYELSQKIRTISVVDVTDHIRIVPDSFRLLIGKKKVNVSIEHDVAVSITQKDIRQQVLMDQYHTVMDRVVQNADEQHIYLARLSVVKAGTTYTIEKVEPMPFQQYVYHNAAQTILHKMDLDGYGQTKSRGSAGVPEHIAWTGKKEDQFVFATGETLISLGIGGVAGQKFFSQEIAHGLGLGSVTILLGVADNMQEQSCIVYGDQGIFGSKNNKSSRGRVTLAAKVDPKTGKFTIGVKCIDRVDESQLRIQWTAIKDRQDMIAEIAQRSMYIKPDMLNLSVKQSHYYEAIISGESESRVKWSVKQDNGGTIDENGMYTAPDVPGVYEIIARSMDDSDMKASTFVVVRNKKQE